MPDQQLSDIDLAHQIASAPPAGSAAPDSTAAAPGAAPPAPAGGNIWKDVGVGGWEALNTVGMGLPGLIWNIANKPTYQNWNSYVNTRPLAKTIGDVAGLAGSFAIPGGALFDVGRAGAEGLGMVGLGSKLAKLANIARTGEGASAFGRGALLGLEQGVPRAAIQGAQTTLDTGDVGQGLKQAAIGSGLSALGGGALGAISGKLSNLKGITQNIANEADRDFVSRTLGVSAKDMRKASSLYGLDARENYWKDTAYLLRSKGITGKAAAKDLVNESGAMFQKAGEAYNGASPDLTKLIDDPQIQAIKAQYPTVDTDGILQDLLQNTAARTGFAEQKAFLSKITERNLRNPAAKMDDDAQADLAGIIKNRINDMGMDLSGQSAPDANALYHQLKPIKNALERQAISPDRLTAGSDTFARLTMDSVLGGGGAAGGLGGAAAIPGGQILNRLASGAANKVLGGVEKLVGPAIRSPAGQALIGGASSLAPLAMQAARLPGIEQGPKQPEQPAQAPPPSDDQVHAGAQQLAGASQNPQAFQQQLMRELQVEYQSDPAFYYRYSFPEFAQMAAQATQGFSLDNPKTYSILAHDKEAGGKLYQATKQYQYLQQIDLPSALSLPTDKFSEMRQAIGRTFGMSSAQANQAKTSYDQLVRVFANASGKDLAQGIDKETYGKITDLLTDIRRQNMPMEQKMAMVYQALQQSGMPIDRMRQLGLAGVRNATAP